MCNKSLVFKVRWIERYLLERRQGGTGSRVRLKKKLRGIPNVWKRSVGPLDRLSNVFH